jgi:hypothetical protein
VLSRTQIASLVFEWLGVEVAKFYISQHKICSECSVFVSPECVNVDDYCSGVAGHGGKKIIKFSPQHYTINVTKLPIIHSDAVISVLVMPDQGSPQ